MKRRWISLAHVEIFSDQCHQPDGKGGFVVDEKKDGQTWQQHRDGIDYIKKVIEDGQKILPILVVDEEDGTYTRLDGFKRCMAHQELGEKFIEAFVCSKEEYRRQDRIQYGNAHITCYHGGLPKEDFSLFENGATETFDYNKVEFLFKSPNPHGLRIELDECIHVHWHTYGSYRLTLGRRDFEALAEAISKI